MYNLLLFFYLLVAVFGIFLIIYIVYIIYHGIKKIKEGFSTKKDYMLFRDFKKTLKNETNISLKKKKSILNQLKNQLIF